MKRLFIAATVLALVITGGVVLAQQQGSGQGQGYGPQGQGWFCPWCGQTGTQGQGMGPGMMGQGYRGQGMMHGQQGMMRGQGMGQGMHRGQGMMYGGQQGMRQGCPYNQQGMQQKWGRGQYGPQGGQQQPVTPMNAEQARQLAENYVAGNPNVKVGQIEEQGQDTYKATIVTQDGSLVEKLLIDKKTGWMKREY